MATVCVASVRYLLDFRLWEVVTKYLSEYCTQGERAKSVSTLKIAYSVDFGTGVLAFGVAVVGAPLAERFLNHPDLAPFIFLAAIASFLETINGTSSAVLRVFDRFKWLSAAQVCRGVTGLASVGGVLLLGGGLQLVLLAAIVTAGVWSVLLSSFAYKTLQYELEGFWSDGKISLLRDRLGEMGGFLFHTNMNAMWKMIINQLDVLILGRYRGAEEVGIYSLAKNLVSVLAKLHDPLYYSVYPEITKLWAKGDVGVFSRFLKRLTWLTLIVFGSITVCMVLGARLFVVLATGPEYLPAVTTMSIMIWGTTISCVFTWARPTIIAVGRPGVANVAGAVGATTVLVFSLLLVPSFGYIASAALLVWHAAIAHLIVLGGSYRHIRRVRAVGEGARR